MKHKFWIRVRFCGEIIDRFFLDYPKMNYFITKHNIKDKDSFKVVTKDMYISQMAGKADLNTLNIQWNRISKGHNFVLLKEDPISYRYYNVEEIDRLFERDNLEKCKVEECKVTTCMHGKLDSVSTKQNKETSYEVHM